MKLQAGGLVVGTSWPPGSISAWRLVRAAFEIAVVGEMPVF